MSNECRMCDKHTYFSKSEVSDMLSVPIPTLNDWISSGLLVRTLVGPRQVRFSQEDLQELIKRIPVDVK